MSRHYEAVGDVHDLLLCHISFPLKIACLAVWNQCSCFLHVYFLKGYWKDNFLEKQEILVIGQKSIYVL